MYVNFRRARSSGSARRSSGCSRRASTSGARSTRRRGGELRRAGAAARGIQHAVAPLVTAFTRSRPRSSGVSRHRPSFIFDGDRAAARRWSSARALPARRVAREGGVPSGGDGPRRARAARGPAPWSAASRPARGMLETPIANRLGTAPPRTRRRGWRASSRRGADRDRAGSGGPRAGATPTPTRWWPAWASPRRSAYGARAAVQCAARSAPALNRRKGAPAARFGARAARRRLEQVISARSGLYDFWVEETSCRGWRSSGGRGAAMAVLRGPCWSRAGRRNRGSRGILERVIPKLPPSLRAFADRAHRAPRSSGSWTPRRSSPRISRDSHADARPRARLGGRGAAARERVGETSSSASSARRRQSASSRSRRAAAARSSRGRK
jgi:hypothetical protein